MQPHPDPRGYLIAPVLAPSLHVLFTPIWAMLGGQSELALLAMTWQVVAWFALVAICLATHSPALWLMRQHIARFPHQALRRHHKITIGVVASALASLFLIGPVQGVRFIPGAWLLSCFASACFMSGLYARPTGLTGSSRGPQPASRVGAP